MSRLLMGVLILDLVLLSYSLQSKRLFAATGTADAVVVRAGQDRGGRQDDGRRGHGVLRRERPTENDGVLGEKGGPLLLAFLTGPFQRVTWTRQEVRSCLLASAAAKKIFPAVRGVEF